MNHACNTHMLKIKNFKFNIKKKERERDEKFDLLYRNGMKKKKKKHKVGENRKGFLRFKGEPEIHHVKNEKGKNKFCDQKNGDKIRKTQKIRSHRGANKKGKKKQRKKKKKKAETKDESAPFAGFALNIGNKIK